MADFSKINRRQLRMDKFLDLLPSVVVAVTAVMLTTLIIGVFTSPELTARLLGAF